MAPSTFAMDYLNSVNVAYTNSNAVPKQKEKRQPNNETFKVIPGTKSNDGVLSTKRTIGLVACVLFVAMILIGLIFLNATASEIKYNINSLSNQNSKIENEINLLNTKIETANSISYVSEYASLELGLGAANSEQYVVVSSSDIVQNLSETIKSKIYR